MQTAYKTKYDILRMTLGVIFLGWSSVSVFNIITYTENAYLSLYEYIPNELLITIGSSLLPFLTFFSGLQLLLNTSVKCSIQIAVLIVSTLAITTLLSHSYYYAIGCGFILMALAELKRQCSRKKGNCSGLRSSDLLN